MDAMHVNRLSKLSWITFHSNRNFRCNLGWRQPSKLCLDKKQIKSSVSSSSEYHMRFFIYLIYLMKSIAVLPVGSKVNGDSIWPNDFALREKHFLISTVQIGSINRWIAKAPICPIQKSGHWMHDDSSGLWQFLNNCFANAWLGKWCAERFNFEASTIDKE